MSPIPIALSPPTSSQEELQFPRYHVSPLEGGSVKQGLHRGAFSHCCGCPHVCPEPHSLESTEDTADSNAASQACPFSHLNLSQGIYGLCNLLPKENSHAVQCNTTLLTASRLRKPPGWEAWIWLEMSRSSILPPPQEVQVHPGAHPKVGSPNCSFLES